MVYLITEWGKTVDEFLEESQMRQSSEEEHKALVSKVQRKVLEMSQYLHALGFSHQDIKQQNMLVVPDETEDDFKVVFIDYGSGQAGNTVSIQFVHRITTFCCMTPSLMFGTSTEFCCQSRDVFALVLRQLESFIGTTRPLLHLIHEDLKGAPSTFREALYHHWKTDNKEYLQGTVLKRRNGKFEMTDERIIIADCAYAYLVLSYTENKTVMNSIKSMWGFDAERAVKASSSFNSAVKEWSLELGRTFKCVRQDNDGEGSNKIYPLLKFGMHPCSSLCPTVYQLYAASFSDDGGLEDVDDPSFDEDDTFSSPVPLSATMKVVRVEEV